MKVAIRIMIIIADAIWYLRLALIYQGKADKVEECIEMVRSIGIAGDEEVEQEPMEKAWDLSPKKKTEDLKNRDYS